MSVVRLALACIFGLLVALPTFAAEVAPGVTGRCDMTIKGILREGDGKVFATQFTKLALKPRLTLCLDSGGGDYLEALDIIRIMVESDTPLATRIEKGGRCLSACALIFLAGNKGEDGLRPARTMDATAQLGFHGPYLPSDDASYDPRQAPLAYQAGVQAIGELMALPAGTDLFPETLLAQALDSEPGAFLLIDTVRKASRWSISVDGTKMPLRLDQLMLHRACTNDDFRQWDMDRREGVFKDAEPRPEPLRFKDGKARAKFGGFGDEEAYFCVVDAVEFAPGRYAIDLQTVEGSDTPARNTQSLLRAARAAKGGITVGKPIWSMFEPSTPLRDLAAP